MESSKQKNGAYQISVIVPVYNVESYLKRCVDSILAQTVKELEIILVDDGSTDGSGALCDAYGEQHEQVKVLHKRNGGLTSAWKAGLALAYQVAQLHQGGGCVAEHIQCIRVFCHCQAYGFLRACGAVLFCHLCRPFIGEVALHFQAETLQGFLAYACCGHCHIGDYRFQLSGSDFAVYVFQSVPVCVEQVFHSEIGCGVYGVAQCPKSVGIRVWVLHLRDYLAERFHHYLPAFAHAAVLLIAVVAARRDHVSVKTVCLRVAYDDDCEHVYLFGVELPERGHCRFLLLPAGLTHIAYRRVAASRQEEYLFQTV